MNDHIDHITIPVTCPHCGDVVAVCIDANTYTTGHTIARCDCDKPFAVSYTVRVNAVATALHDDIDLE